MSKKVSNNKEVTKVTNSFDMGSTPMWKLFKKTWIPTLIAGLIGGTFVVFDTFFVSQGYQLGHIGYIWSWNSSGTSIGVGSMVYIQAFVFILVGAGFLVGTAISEKMAKAKAENDHEAYMKAYNSYFPTTVFVGGVLGIILFALAKPLIWMGSGFQPYYVENWFNSPLWNPNWDPNNYSDLIGQELTQSSWYLRIQALSAIPFVIMLSAPQVLRIEGKGNIATWFALVALAGNVGWDFLLINVFGLNLVGAGLASLFAQVTVMFLYLWYFTKKFPIKMGKWDWSFAKKDMSKTLKIGRTSFLLQGINCIILLSLTIGLGILYWGDHTTILIYQSTFQGYFSLYTAGMIVVTSTALAMMPIATYNNEQGKYDRVKSVRKISFNIAIWFSLAFSLLFFIYPNLGTFFTDKALISGNFPFTYEVSIGYVYRITQMLFFTFVIGAFYTMMANYLQAIGKNKQSGRIILVKPIIVFPLVLIMGFATQDSITAWSNSILPWIDDLAPVNGEYLKLGVFWGLVLSDLVPFSIASYYYLIERKSTSIQ